MQQCLRIFGVLWGSHPYNSIRCLSQNFKRTAGPPGSNWCFSFEISIVGQLTESAVESSFLIHQDVYRDLSVCS